MESALKSRVVNRSDCYFIQNKLIFAPSTVQQHSEQGWLPHRLTPPRHKLNLYKNRTVSLFPETIPTCLEVQDNVVT